MLRQVSATLVIRPDGPGLNDFTAKVAEILDSSGISTGLVTLFCTHTSASLLIQENAAPAARRDLERYFEAIAPESPHYQHDDEGPDDMPAHLRSALTQTHLAIPVVDGKIGLGTWQGIYLFEHRRDPGPRTVLVHLVGE